MRAAAAGDRSDPQESQGRVVNAWVIGSVILGVLALVARNRHVTPPRRSRRQLTQEEKAAVDREFARRKRDRDSVSDDRQGGRE